MLLSLNWLKEYVEIDAPSIEIASKLSDSGSHAESVISYKEHVKGIITAKILSVKKHENADRLSVCEVDFGSEKDIIVTAATNMKEGDVVGVARPGSILADGTNIEPHDFRGIISNGMFISFEELGFTKDVIPKESLDGLLILDANTPLGINIFEALNLMDDVIEFEITPNRTDCLSVLGMAIEAQATFDKKRKALDAPMVDRAIDTDLIDVKVTSDKINSYVCGEIKDVIIKPSPMWLKIRLMEMGVRPINNIVDITNYVMLETGVPMHAFDVDELPRDDSGKITMDIKEADKKEKFTLLDNSEVDLEPGDLLITAGGKTIGLAGIMGGLNSEITEKTTHVLFEGAHFNRQSIKNTAKRLNINTEAKNRFSKPLDSSLAKTAVLRALRLSKELYDLDGNYEEFKLTVPERKTITLRPSRLNALLGMELDIDYMLKALNLFEIESKLDGDKIISVAPSFRPDLNIEADLIEEIGRLYGYGNIESQPISSHLSVGYQSKIKLWSNKLRHFLQGFGYTEVLTYSFVGPELLNKTEIAIDENTIKIENPLGEEFSVMRPSFVPHFLEIAEKNERRFNGELKVFEIGQVFKNDGGYNELTDITIMNSNCGDFYDLSATVNAVLDYLNISNYQIERSDALYLHPGKAAKIIYDGDVIAEYGEIEPDNLEAFNIKKTFIATIYLSKFIDKVTEEKIYQAPSKYPSTTREFSFVLDDKIAFGEIKNKLMSNNIDNLQSIGYYDEYRGVTVGEGKKSLTIQANIFSNDKTLTEEEINSVTNSIIEIVSEEFGGTLRQ